MSENDSDRIAFDAFLITSDAVRVVRRHGLTGQNSLENTLSLVVKSVDRLKQDEIKRKTEMARRLE